ncbi:MAG: hypothetical protein WAL35_06945, partial [Acidimicrobiales bacterium]
AVGSYSFGTGSGASAPGRALIESWKGTTWSVVPNPSPPVAYLFATSCAAARSCRAVGEYQGGTGLFRALVESWNGATWSVEPSPSPTLAYLYGVSCVSARSCRAVGQSAEGGRGSGPALALTESWNGGTWSV